MILAKMASPEIPYFVGHDQHGVAVQQGSEGKNDQRQHADNAIDVQTPQHGADHVFCRRQVVDYTNEKFNKGAFTNAIVFVTIGVF
ncbi:hypothetical protein BBI17_009579 [Phytophthora kernoviae]|uniref:Uncharacterized protein n=2 Tax=Phytophthora kernoviae TaxID=325452 RepID=A0A3R7IJM7_9STRA|nr:hypothetical protein G195_011498 [Phytophthora kernoviae 00238/432]KAG2502734.1 hypothetical protein JM16_009642 [Phytophthora kernoviae]RLN25931.1 hypothetical protein BBI17_009579 [Phytophthora kernoviae]